MHFPQQKPTCQHRVTANRLRLGGPRNLFGWLQWRPEPGRSSGAPDIRVILELYWDLKENKMETRIYIGFRVSGLEFRAQGLGSESCFLVVVGIL